MTEICTVRPDFALIVDWDTGTEAAGTRAARSLGELVRQLRTVEADIGLVPELVIVADAAETEAMRAAVAQCGWTGAQRLETAPAGLDYYQKKNRAATLTSADLLVFIDSDLLPEPGWLAAMLRPFSDPARSVVVGLTHFDTATLYQRAMALFWIFEPREESDLLRPTRRLVSNNIAFRTRVFAALPYPDRPTYRGQCSELGGRLIGLGLVMTEATAARASHPPPLGLSGFVMRAWYAGRDTAYYECLAGRANGLGQIYAVWRHDLRVSAKRVMHRDAALRPNGIDRLCALFLRTIYYTLKALAQILPKSV